MLDLDYTEDNVRTSLVKESWEELARALNEAKHDADLRDGVVGTTCSRMRSEPLFSKIQDISYRCGR